MAAGVTLGKSCQSGKDSYLFDLAGKDIKWRTISLTHVEYPEGNCLIESIVRIVK